MLIKTEPRGLDATGFWACLEDNRIVYHKEPIKSTVFVNNQLWQSLEELNPNLLLGHCRWTSMGGGSEKINKNNHPHVSSDCRLALIHNGKIPEYNHLKKKYDVLTDCDSEILLRIFESGEHHHDQPEYLRKELPKMWEDTSDQLLYRVLGLKRLFSEISYGAMAVAIGERLDGIARSLLLFRNDQRPLCLIDLQDTLGQIFFCSTPEIFRQALDASSIAKEVIPPNQSLYPELTENWIYSFVYTEEEKIEIRSCKINKTRKYGVWEEKDIVKSDKPVRSSINVITQLDESEEVIKTEEDIVLPNVEPVTTVVQQIETKKKTYHNNWLPKIEGDDFGDEGTLTRETAVSTKILANGYQEIKNVKSDDEYEIVSHRRNRLVSEIKETCNTSYEILKEIETHIHNKTAEGSLLDSDLEELLEGLRSMLSDLRSSKCLLLI